MKNHTFKNYELFNYNSNNCIKDNVSFKHKRLCQKHILETWFYFNTNIKIALSNFDNLIKKEIDKKLFYFWKRNIWILEIIEKVKKWESSFFEEDIFFNVMRHFWNREFFKAIYSINDNRASWIVKLLEYFTLSPTL